MTLIDRLLGRKTPDGRSTNQLIYDLAEYRGREQDVSELYRRFSTMELYAAIAQTNLTIQNGTTHTIGKNDVVALQNVRLPTGQVMVRFMVDRTDSRLLPRFMSITARNACEMVLKTTGTDGMMLCNPTDSWFAMLRPEIQRILKEMPA